MAPIGSASIAIGRIIARIIVWHMSAHIMHIWLCRIISSMVISEGEPAHIRQACSQALHASMHSCIADMSIFMPSGIRMPIMSIFMIVTCFWQLEPAG